MDTRVITAYLTATHTLHTGPLTKPLGDLVGGVRARLGDRPLVDLAARPADPAVSGHVAAALQRAADLDPDFAAELDRYRRELDAAGGRAALTAYQPYDPRPGGSPVYGILAGAATYVRRAPRWAFAMLGVGLVMALVGFVVFAMSAFSAASDWTGIGGPDIPSTTIVGLVLFIVGGGLAVAGQFAIVLARRRA